MITNYFHYFISFLKKLLPFFILMMSYSLLAQGTISGELRKWHTVTVTFDGPSLDEESAVNPFTNYRLNVTFVSPNGEQFVVPGFFAADGNAAETSATSGNKWAVRFKPNALGNWTYNASFRTGTDVAVSLDPTAGNPTSFDGASGNFSVGANNKLAPDNRANGRLNYVNERYLQWEETGKFFLKVGADSPETMLAYNDIDNTIPYKTWSPHAGDWNPGDPVWQGDKGKELIGAINYLAGKGMNAFSFITMNVDDPEISRGSSRNNIWPWTSAVHTDLNDDTASEINNRLRYDVSKLEQWEIIFDHGDKKGMYLHFKMQESGNHRLLDDGALGIERKLYYRELIARFGHHLALNWNLGEEFWIYNPTLINSFASYIKDLDPYDHNLVIHCYPNSGDESLFRPLLGPDFNLSGISVQTFVDGAHVKIRKWVQDSEASGKKWVVAFDEQGHWNRGVGVDADHGGSKGEVEDNRAEIRSKALWAAVMAGGAGVEYYFGGRSGQNDINAEDWRSRDSKWGDAKVAYDFFNDHLEFWEMDAYDELISGDESLNYCLAKPGDSYAIYLTNGGEESLDLSAMSGDYTVKWFDPRTGGALLDGNVVEIQGGGVRSLGTAPVDANLDWVILVEKVEESNISVTEVQLTPATATLNEGEVIALNALVLPTDATNTNVVWSSNNTSVATVDQNGQVNAIAEGFATITVTTVDGNFTDTSEINVVIPTVSVNGINVTPATLTINEGETATLSAQVMPANATNRNISWSSGDETIASISTLGEVTGLQAGTVTITASTIDGNFIDTSEVTVEANTVSVTRVSVSPETAVLDPGESIQLAAQIFPANATNPAVVWSSSNTRVATIDQNGLVVAIAEGITLIRAITEDGNLVDTSVITVNQEENSSELVSLTLVDADSDSDLFDLTDQMEIPIGSLQGINLNVRANTAPDLVGSVVLVMNGPVDKMRTESVAPYALYGDNAGNYFGALLPVGNYTITATAYTGASASGSIINEITRNFSIVNNTPANQPPNAVITATPLTGTAPLEVNFTGSNSTDDIGVVGYIWDFGDGSSYTQPDPVHTFTEAGIYNVVLTVLDDEGLLDTDSITITVTEPIVTNGFTLVDATSDTDLFNMEDGMQINRNDIEGTLLNIRSNFDDLNVGSVSFSLTGPVTKVSKENFPPFALFGDRSGDYNGVAFLNGNYSLTASAYSGANLSGTVLQTIAIDFSIVDPLNIKIAINDIKTGDTLGTEAQKVKVKLYPNPTAESVFVSMTGPPSDQLTSVSVFDMNGRMIRNYDKASINATKDAFKFNVGNLPNGVYFTHLRTNSGFLFKYRVVVKH